MRLLHTLLTLWLCAITTLSAQNELPIFIREDLNGYVEKAMKAAQVPAMAIAIVKNGKVVHQRGYGVRTANTNESVDENTLFMIGSNTKAFTATALAMLQEEGKLSLDDKVTRWLPNFKMKDPYLTEQVIIRDLLCHRLGFETFEGDFVHWCSNLTRQEVIGQIGKMTTPYPFRTKWGYCNAAFSAAGEIIPQAGDQQWEDFLRERIFTPLSMKRTLATAAELTTAKNAATPYTIYQDNLTKLPYPVIDNLAAAGSISSSAADMANWVMMQLGGGVFKGDTVVKSKAIRETRFPHSILGNARRERRQTNFQLYGLGWFLQDYQGRRLVMHDGGVDGFLSSVTLVPSDSLGIVILTNTDQNALYEALRWTIVDAFLGIRDIDYVAEMQKQQKQQQEEDRQQRLKWAATKAANPRAELPLDNYVGIYQNEVYGTVEVKNETGGLKLYLSRHPNMTGKLEELGGNEFLCTFSNPTFGIKVQQFEVENGAVKNLTVHVADFVDFLPYVFTKL